jgi:hypothetical protein
VDHAVQDNRQPFFDVIPGDPVKVFRPLGVELQRDVRLAESVTDLDLGALKGVTGQERFVFEKNRVL